MKANKAKIIDLMCAKDLTQEQLAKGCGVRAMLGTLGKGTAE